MCRTHQRVFSYHNSSFPGCISAHCRICILTIVLSCGQDVNIHDETTIHQLVRKFSYKLIIHTTSISVFYMMPNGCCFILSFGWSKPNNIVVRHDNSRKNALATATCKYNVQDEVAVRLRNSQHGSLVMSNQSGESEIWKDYDKTAALLLSGVICIHHDEAFTHCAHTRALYCFLLEGCLQYSHQFVKVMHTSLRCKSTDDNNPLTHSHFSDSLGKHLASEYV